MITRAGSSPALRTIIRTPAPGLTFERLAVLLLFVAILGAACLMPAQSDTFWQLRAGADTVASGRVQLTDRMTHTVNGGDWPNHEWASEVSFYLLHRAGGFPLLTLALACLVTWAWWNVWRLMDGPVVPGVVLVAILAVSSARLWSLRPQVVSLCLLVAAVRLLASGRDRWLPPLFLVWANFHGGVLLGFAAVAGALVGRALHDLGTVRRAAVLLAACAAAVCVTPLGPRLWTQVPSMVDRIRAIEIAEWQPTLVADPWNLPFWIVALAIPLLAWRQRALMSRSDAIVVGACVALILLGLRTTRNVMPALMLAAPALSRLALRTLPARPHTRHERPLANIVVAGAACACLAGAVTVGWARPAARLNWYPIPDGLGRAIARCPANLYNLYDHGGYITWLVPSQPVFADGRQDPFPPSLILAQVHAEQTGEYRELFRDYDVNCAALPHGSKVRHALARDGWYTAYADEHWAVLTRP